MDNRKFAAGASATPPVAPVSPSVGHPQSGDPGSGTQATKLGAYWYYQLGEEVRRVITDAGLVPDHANLAQLSAAVQLMIAGGGAYPFAALPFPTIDTSTNQIAVTSSAVAGQGGAVSVPAGVYFSLGESVSSNTGRLRSFQTAAWVSGNLAVSSTYYLRVKVVGGALVFYTQKGADTDAIPAGLVGVVDGASGGGFDSTVLDMLVAKVVTGSAGTVPTVTALANKAFLSFSSLYQTTCTADGVGTFSLVYNPTLNWARTPKVTASIGYDITAVTSGSALDRCYISSQVVSRYALNFTGYFDIFTSVSGSVLGNINVLGVA